MDVFLECIEKAEFSHLLSSVKHFFCKFLPHIDLSFKTGIYIDDLKLYAKNDRILEEMINTTHIFSSDIGMTFGIEKCAKVTLKKGKQIYANNINLTQDLTVQDLDQETNYKYLGIEESGNISHEKMKEKIRKEFYRRVRKVIKTDLNSKNKMMAINSLAIPVVTYSYNIINWRLSEIKQMDVKVRKILTINKMHHPKADIDRMYLPRSEGGRGMLQLENAYKISTIGLNWYLANANEPFLKCIYQQDKTKKLYSITRQNEKFRDEINLSNYKDIETDNKSAAEKAKRIKSKSKLLMKNLLKEKWKNKPLHGQFLKRITAPSVSLELSTQWLNSSGLKGETEGLILAAQDQSLATNNYKTNISKTENDDKCRICKLRSETIDHIVAGCPVLAPTEYMERHNKIGKYLHWHICKSENIEVNKKWYKHQPEPVTENENCTILWDFGIHTDKMISANRPDIIIKYKEEKQCILIDMSVPCDANITTKEFEKKSKYKNLEIEIQRMWQMKTKVVPIVVGALGTVTKDFESCVKLLPETISSNEIQKIALLGTAHILRKILSI